jgi:hypothetical protein
MQERLKNDFYPTPERLTKSLLTFFQPDGIVLEPCAGDGAIVNVLKNESMIKNVITNDIVNGKAQHCFDATQRNLYDSIGKVDYVVTNPPFSQPDCQQIIDRCWDKVECGMAFLLRLTYLEPCGNRASFLKNTNLSKLIIFNPRPRFREDTKGSDNCTVAWFVWEKRDTKNGTSVIFETNWRDR